MKTKVHLLGALDAALKRQGLKEVELELPANANLYDLLAKLSTTLAPGFDSSLWFMLGVAVNGEIVPREEWLTRDMLQLSKSAPEALVNVYIVPPLVGG